MYRNFLAPIYNYSDLPFRMLCQKYGAETTCVPMVNATAIARNSSKLSMVDAHPDEKNIGIQIVGENPRDIKDTCVEIADNISYASWLNLNCGCPSPRTMRCGGGSALLKHPKKIVQSVTEMKHTDFPVSVKIRIKHDLEETIQLCKEIEEAGADFLIIHGRTMKQGYSGKSDWDLIKSLKENLDTPLVGNGDITSKSQGRKFVKEGYCDSFMVGRAAMVNPMLFRDGNADTLKEKFRLLKEYISLSERYDMVQLPAIKIKAMQFICGIRNAAKLRKMIYDTKSIEEIFRLEASQ